MGLPGLAGAEHIGITVPDLDAATRFFVDVIGCKIVFEVAPSPRTMTGCSDILA
jgi:catechol 2,3-dioxygenase-like lactoylglutathione lyase family enzyme